MMTLLVREAIGAFVSAVSASWPAVTTALGKSQRLTRNELLDDWLQSMWEMIVEASLSRGGATIFLEVYGEGADCNPRSSRVYRPDALPTSAIHCFPSNVSSLITDALTGNEIVFPDEGLPIDRFVRLDGLGWYNEAPPFDHVLVSAGGREAVLKCEHLDFDLAPRLRNTGDE